MLDSGVSTPLSFGKGHENEAHLSLISPQNRSRHDTKASAREGFWGKRNRGGRERLHSPRLLIRALRFFELGDKKE
jgi:hypothetical protein